MKIIGLESPYKELATKYAYDDGWSDEYIRTGLELSDAFDWEDTFEGYDFWSLVNINEKPPIKDSKLLAELTKVDTIMGEISNFLGGQEINGKDILLDEIREILKKHI